jgi:uncharacterized membrane protein YphA (DoxX/SURF4 family)
MNKAKPIIHWVLALALAVVFGSSGIWKLYAPAQAGIRQVEAGVPSAYALPWAVVLGAFELFAAVLLVVPAWRRGGALLAGALALSFMIYMGARYSELKGMECGCMPGRHRALDGWFFVEDGAMLAAAMAVAWLAGSAAAFRRAFWKPALALLLIVCVGAASATLERTMLAGNASLSLRVMDRSGKVAEMPLSPRSETLLYFMSPSCLDCQRASLVIGKLRLAAPLVVVPDSRAESIYEYLNQAGIKNAVISLDYATMAPRLQLKQVPALYVFLGAAPQALILNFDPAALEKELRSRRLLN